tara:strand:+ start:448 stop:735 length:288 start_codon:yes stop_codon:yes gene_type:complete
MERAGPDGTLFLKPVTAGVSWRRRVKRTGRARTENLGPKGRLYAPVGAAKRGSRTGASTGALRGIAPAGMGCAGDFGSGQGKGLSPIMEQIKNLW